MRWLTNDGGPVTAGLRWLCVGTAQLKQNPETMFPSRLPARGWYPQWKAHRGHGMMPPGPFGCPGSPWAWRTLTVTHCPHLSAVWMAC